MFSCVTVVSCPLNFGIKNYKKKKLIFNEKILNSIKFIYLN